MTCLICGVQIRNEVYIHIMLVAKILLFSYTVFFLQQLLRLSPSTITHHSTNYDPAHISITLRFIHL